MRRAIFVVLVAICSLVAARSAAQGPSPEVAGEVPAEVTAEVLAAQARDAYREGRFEEAAELFGRAYEGAGVATLLYNRARALENAGRNEDAITAYERYLATDDPIEDRAGIAERVARLRARVEEQRRLEEERARLEAELAARRAAPPPEPAAQPPPEPSAVPWVIGGVGVLGLAAGVTLASLAEDRHQAAVAEPVQERAAALQVERDDLALAANVAFVAGGVLAAAGVVWGAIDLAGALDARDRAAPEPAIRVSVGPSSIALRATF